jgi:hypothetical protein
LKRGVFEEFDLARDNPSGDGNQYVNALLEVETAAAKVVATTGVP